MFYAVQVGVVLIKHNFSEEFHSDGELFFRWVPSGECQRIREWIRKRFPFVQWIDCVYSGGDAHSSCHLAGLPQRSVQLTEANSYSLYLCSKSEQLYACMFIIKGTNFDLQTLLLATHNYSSK